VADLAGRAVFVFDALGRSEGYTRSVGISCIADLTPALSQVLADQAVGVFGARVAGFARIDAVSVLAGSGQGAFRI